MNEYSNTMTKEDYVEKEIRVWGFDYIESLFNQGYEVVRSSDGKWGWKLTSSTNRITRNRSRLTRAR